MAFLTGQSDPDRCALSPEQRAFLIQLDGEERELVPTNFPYRPTVTFRDVHLLRACWNNLWLYFRSRNPEFAATYQVEVTALIDRAEYTFFLVGSCGLELFNNLSLPRELETRCTLICYGPVARRLPRHARSIIVRSSGDYVSRPFFRHAPLQLRCGHMGYLRDPEFLRFCQAQLALYPSRLCSSTSA